MRFPARAECRTCLPRAAAVHRWARRPSDARRGLLHARRRRHCLDQRPPRGVRRPCGLPMPTTSGLVGPTASDAVMPARTAARSRWRCSRTSGEDASRKLLVRRSMLLLAVSDFELLMGQVAELIMNLMPGLASAGDASITLSEHEHLKDVQAARKGSHRPQGRRLASKDHGGLGCVVRPRWSRLEGHGR